MADRKSRRSNRRIIEGTLDTVVGEAFISAIPEPSGSAGGLVRATKTVGRVGLLANLSDKVFNDDRDRKKRRRR